MVRNVTADDLLVLSPEDYKLLDEDDFGVPGLVATEIIGPFVRVRAAGPLLMVHDGVFEPHRGISHHPHRYNERLFYILEGAVDHDDALNGITGHMATGDMGRLTEGRRGMLHQEWNNTDGRARAFILVYETSPVPERASFAALRDIDAPRYQEAVGVLTKELVGPRSQFPLHGDIRLFTDSTLEPGATLDVEIESGAGALLVPLEGEISVGERQQLSPSRTVVIAPDDEARSVQVRALTKTRLLRTVYGPGRGLLLVR